MEFINLKAQYKAYKKDIDKRIKGVIDTAHFIMGDEVSELESALATYCGARYAIACSSGTDALILSLMALDIKEGDEVITSPFSFIASVEAIMLLKAKPVFVDIDEKTYNLNPHLLERAITSRTKAIIPVSIFGQMPDMIAINAIALKYRIPVIEDGAQSFGASMGNAPESSAADSNGGAADSGVARNAGVKNAQVRDTRTKDSKDSMAESARSKIVKDSNGGAKSANVKAQCANAMSAKSTKSTKAKSVKSCNASLLATTSFFPSKPLGCYGDGGAVFTSDEILATKLRYLLNHGQIERYKHRYVGLNSRLDAIQAAVLNAKLPHLDDEIAIRQEIASVYNANLNNVITPFVAKGHKSAYAQYSIRVQNRDKFIQKLQKRGIPTAVHYPIPLHLQEVILKRYKRISLPVSQQVCQEIVSLPFSAFLSVKEQEAVIRAINE